MKKETLCIDMAALRVGMRERERERESVRAREGRLSGEFGDDRLCVFKSVLFVSNQA